MEIELSSGCDYFEDPDGTFVSQLRKSIDMLAETYKKLFNDEPPKGHKTPLDKMIIQN